MSYLSVEESHNNKPTLLLSLPEGILKTILIPHFKENFKIIFLGDAGKDITSEEDFTVIGKKSLYLVDKLSEGLDYAVLVVNKELTQMYPTLQHIIEQNRTKTIFLLPETEWNMIDEYLPSALPHSARVLLMGDIISLQYGARMPESISFLIHAVKDRKLKIESKDVSPLYVIGEQDFLTGLDDVLFGHGRRHQFCNLFYQEPQLYISAAHILRRIEPDLSMEFGDTPPPIPEQSPLAQANHTIHTRYASSLEYLDGIFLGFEKTVKNFSEKIRMADASFFPSFEQVSSRKLRLIPSLHLPKFSQLLITAVMVWIILQGAFASFGVYLIKEGITNLIRGNIINSTQELSLGDHLLMFSYPIVAVGSPLLASLSPTFNADIKLVPELPLILTLSKSLNNHELDEKKFNQTIASIRELVFQLEKIAAEDKNNQAAKILSLNGSAYFSVLDLLPELLGYDHKKTYLIEFQNNSELRPDGGFIGSIGRVAFNSGKMENLNINDVYNIDGQLKAHVEPHYIIRRYLEPHLFLRDSNFDPNFEVSASAAAELYDDAVHERVDGIIAIDFDVIKDILKITGPLTLPTTHTVVTSDSIGQFLETSIQSNFFPGSLEKQTLLKELESQIQLHLEENSDDRIALLKIIPTLLLEKHILVAFPDESIENLFSTLGLSDNFKDDRPSQNTALDSLSINEANIGVDKVNADVTRSMDYDLIISNDKNPQSVATETISNSNASLSYKAYLRFLVPVRSALSTIEIDGKEQHIIPAITEPRIYESKGFKAPLGLEVDQTNENNLQSFGFVITVPPKTQQKIQVTYKNSISIPNSHLYTYSLLYFKQPGTESYPLNTTIHFPNGTVPQKVQDGIFGVDTISIQKTVTTDQEIHFSLIKGTSD